MMILEQAKTAGVRGPSSVGEIELVVEEDVPRAVRDERKVYTTFRCSVQSDTHDDSNGQQQPTGNDSHSHQQRYHIEPNVLKKKEYQTAHLLNKKSTKTKIGC